MEGQLRGSCCREQQSLHSCPSRASPRSWIPKLSSFLPMAPSLSPVPLPAADPGWTSSPRGEASCERSWLSRAGLVALGGTIELGARIGLWSQQLPPRDRGEQLRLPSVEHPLLQPPPGLRDPHPSSQSIPAPALPLSLLSLLSFGSSPGRVLAGQQEQSSEHRCSSAITQILSPPGSNLRRWQGEIFLFHPSLYHLSIPGLLCCSCPSLQGVCHQPVLSQSQPVLTQLAE